MSDVSAGFTLRGTFMHAPRRDEIEILEDAVISVDGAGAIDALHRPGEAGHAAAVAEGRRRGTLTSLGEGRYLLPGLVDLHIHAPQWPQLGKSLHLPLEDWLVHCTFPLEAKYADAAFAELVYASLVETVLANGTTTAVYHATVHLESTMRLADICLARGQRAFVGKVAMDHPDQCPDYYRDESATAAIEGSRDLIAYVRALPGNESGLVRPIITPRFIPSCTDPLLEGLGILAGESACPVQTHCSESGWQHGFVLERYGRSDTRSLHAFGLLPRGTILAHGNFLSGEDMGVIGQAGAGIAHCPLSNYYFSNAVFPLRAALDKGVRVGLGTDISGEPLHPRQLPARGERVPGARGRRRPRSRRERPGTARLADRFSHCILVGVRGWRRSARAPRRTLRARLPLRRDTRRYPAARQQPHGLGGCRQPRGRPSENRLQCGSRRHPQGLDRRACRGRKVTRCERLPRTPPASGDSRGPRLLPSPPDEERGELRGKHGVSRCASTALASHRAACGVTPGCREGESRTHTVDCLV